METSREKVKASPPVCTGCTAVLWEQYYQGMIPVIPDIKCKSPQEGDLLKGRDPVALAKDLSAAGAPLISVVTEKEHFGGSPQLLQSIARAVSLPILRKDFITTREQLLESADLGAGGVLLIVSMLEKKQLFKLVEETLALGMEPLLETHDEDEIKIANELAPTFVGINNRKIADWEMDEGTVSTTEKLAKLVSSEAFVLSESSFSSPAEVLRAKAAGAHGVLIGTAILQAEGPVRKYRELCGSRGLKS